MFFKNTKEKIRRLEEENKQLRKYEKEYETLKLETIYVKQAYDDLQKFINEMDQLCTLGHQIMGLERNSLDQLMCVVYDNGDNRPSSHTLYLHYVDTDSPNYKKPRCYFEVVSDHHINIVDLFSNEDRNMRSGNGSILLSYLDKLCKSKGVNKISGSLSSVDKAYFTQLENFYRKNGFTVSFDSDGENGHIEKRLTN